MEKVKLITWRLMMVCIKNIRNVPYEITARTHMRIYQGHSVQRYS